MQILILSNLYPPYELGGFEQLCQEVVTGLYKRGHQVCVLTSDYGIINKKYHENNVIRTLTLQSDILKYRPIDFLTKWSKQEKKNGTELCKALEQFSPDLIVVWGMWNLSPVLPYLAEQWMPEKVAYYIASYWPMEKDVHEEYWLAPARRKFTEIIKRPLRKIALSNLEKEGYPPRLQFENAKCVSKYVRNELVNSEILSENTGVIYVGIDPKPFLNSPPIPKLRKKPLRLLYFGSLLPQKGVHTAVEALGLLKERGYLHRLNLTILGSGHPDYEAQLKELVESFGIQEKVHFPGWVLRDDIPSWLSKYDVFLFTSIWPEPMARTVMEAMAAGLLIIGSEVGGQTEMLRDGINSLTYQPEDANGLADQIIKALNNPSMRHQLSLSGKKMVLRTFTLDRMTTEFETWLTDISKSHGGDG